MGGVVSDDRLDRIEARAAAATEGPWGTYAAYGSRGVEVIDTEDMVFIQDGGVTYAVHEPDAKFIAHAREDVPALVAAVRGVLRLIGGPDTSAGLVPKSAIHAVIEEALEQ